MLQHTALWAASGTVESLGAIKANEKIIWITSYMCIYEIIRFKIRFSLYYVIRYAKEVRKGE